LAAAQFVGLKLVAEAAVAGEEVDGLIDLNSDISYVVEMKYVKSDDDIDPSALDKAADKALAQIEAKGYAQRYQGTGRRVCRLGVAVGGRGQVLVKPVW
jgi:hypothetical protein